MFFEVGCFLAFVSACLFVLLVRPTSCCNHRYLVCGRRLHERTLKKKKPKMGSMWKNVKLFTFFAILFSFTQSLMINGKRMMIDGATKARESPRRFFPIERIVSRTSLRSHEHAGGLPLERLRHLLRRLRLDRRLRRR